MSPYQTEADKDLQAAMARVCEREWGCELRDYGDFATVDWFALKAGTPVAWAELKVHTRTHPKLYLSYRKWIALMLSLVSTGRPGLFIVGNPDGISWINVGEVDAHRLVMAGRADRPEARNSFEPIILVPAVEMHPLTEVPF